MIGRGISVALSAIAFSATLLSLSASSPAATWKIQRTPFTPRYAGAEVGPLLGISCPSTSLCLTGDRT
jgi:hypothetical protein